MVINHTKFDHSPWFDLLQRATSARPQAARGRVTWPDSILTTAGKQLSVINLCFALCPGQLDISTLRQEDQVK